MSEMPEFVCVMTLTRTVPFERAKTKSDLIFVGKTAAQLTADNAYLTIAGILFVRLKMNAVCCWAWLRREQREKRTTISCCSDERIL